MDIRDIKIMLAGPKVRDMEPRKVSEILLAAILKIYVLAGIAKTYTPKQLEDEANIITGELLKDLLKEGKFASLRAQEIAYAMQCGLKGDFGDLKTFGINYQTLYKWLSAYMDCQDRADALNAIIRELQHKQLQASTAPTLHEQRQMIINHINEEYLRYKSGPISSSPLHISKLGGITDLGGVKDRFLTAEGLKPAGMSLAAYFDKCIEEKKEFIFAK